jgi:hypothetical protein
VTCACAGGVASLLPRSGDVSSLGLTSVLTTSPSRSGRSLPPMLLPSSRAPSHGRGPQSPAVSLGSLPSPTTQTQLSHQRSAPVDKPAAGLPNLSPNWGSRDAGRPQGPPAGPLNLGALGTNCSWSSQFVAELGLAGGRPSTGSLVGPLNLGALGTKLQLAFPICRRVGGRGTPAVHRVRPVGCSTRRQLAVPRTRWRARPARSRRAASGSRRAVTQGARLAIAVAVSALL